MRIFTHVLKCWTLWDITQSLGDFTKGIHVTHILVPFLSKPHREFLSVQLWQMQMISCCFLHMRKVWTMSRPDSPGFFICENSLSAVIIRKALSCLWGYKFVATICQRVWRHSDTMCMREFIKKCICGGQLGNTRAHLLIAFTKPWHSWWQNLLPLLSSLSSSPRSTSVSLILLFLQIPSGQTPPVRCGPAECGGACMVLRSGDQRRLLCIILQRSR